MSNLHHLGVCLANQANSFIFFINQIFLKGSITIVELYKGKRCHKQVLALVSELCMNCLCKNSSQPLTILLVVSVISLLQSQSLIMINFFLILIHLIFFFNKGETPGFTFSAMDIAIFLDYAM